MRTRYLHCLILACMVGVFLTGCDQSAQNIDYQVGENLTVKGPTSVVLPNTDTTVTAEHLVKAFTINKEYSWSVEGIGSLQGTERQGEKAVVSISETGQYTVTVETTVDGEPASGSAVVEVSLPDDG